MSKINRFSILYFILYVFVFLLAFAVFYNFRPYTYVDNAKSLVVCNKNGASFEIGWNFIYTFDQTLDSFNGIKARKLCEYNAIKDYGNTLKTPSEINYRFEPKYIRESSWADAIFMASATLILGIIFIEFVKVKITMHTNLVRPHQIGKSIILTALFALGLFYLFMYKPAAMIFCKRQIARKVNNFKRVVFKYGVVPIPEEDKHINSVLKPLYEKCLRSEGS